MNEKTKKNTEKKIYEDEIVDKLEKISLKIFKIKKILNSNDVDSNKIEESKILIQKLDNELLKNFNLKFSDEIRKKILKYIE